LTQRIHGHPSQRPQSSRLQLIDLLDCHAHSVPDSLLFFGSSIVRVLGFLLVVLTTLTVYAFFSRQVRQFEIVQENEPIASSLKTRRLADYTNLGIEALIAIMILIPIMVIAYYYPTLPARLPVRVDWLGEVAEWTEKSFSSLFALPILLAYAQGLFLLFKDGFLRGNMTLPAERADEYYHQMDEGLRVGMRFLDWFRLYLVVPLVGFPIVILFRSPEHAHLITQVGVVFGLIYGTVGLVGLNSYAKRKERIDRRLAAIAGRVLIGRETSTPHFFGGGLFYYNRENPAIFIESPIGGYVLNLGNTAAFVYVASLIGLLLLIAWTLF
jgi:uncharacterized membrane protein